MTLCYGESTVAAARHDFPGPAQHETGCNIWLNLGANLHVTGFRRNLTRQIVQKERAAAVHIGAGLALSCLQSNAQLIVTVSADWADCREVPAFVE